MVPYNVQLSVRAGQAFFRNLKLTTLDDRFPLDLVFRIFDSVFGHGIEAIFGFSVVLLVKNEEKLLKLKFDQILDYMKGELFDIYKVCSFRT